MEALAQDTGGKPFYNTNDLSLAVKEAINIGSHYYTLTYTPTNVKLDSKFRRIEVKGKNRSYKLAYRRGYYMERTETWLGGLALKYATSALTLIVVANQPNAEPLVMLSTEPARVPITRKT